MLLRSAGTSLGINFMGGAILGEYFGPNPVWGVFMGRFSGTIFTGKCLGNVQVNFP